MLRDAGERYSTDDIEKEVRAAYDADEVVEESVDERIHKAVMEADKGFKQSSGGRQLSFAGFDWPRSFVLGDKERQPTATGKLQHVLIDQGIREASLVDHTDAVQELRRRNIAVLPYLSTGMPNQVARASGRPVARSLFAGLEMDARRMPSRSRRSDSL
jgi:hypothetical protein